jgi:hypothetical protein
MDAATGGAGGYAGGGGDSEGVGEVLGGGGENEDGGGGDDNSSDVYVDAESKKQPGTHRARSSGNGETPSVSDGRARALACNLPKSPRTHSYAQAKTQWRILVGRGAPKR